MAAVRHLGFIVGLYVWTTHEEYFVTFVTVPNLVGIDVGVSIICRF